MVNFNPYLQNSYQYGNQQNYWQNPMQNNYQMPNPFTPSYDQWQPTGNSFFPFINPSYIMQKFYSSGAYNFLNQQVQNWSNKLMNLWAIAFGMKDRVAANEEGKIEGDPHITGGDGKHFDFQGQAGKTYNLLSDDGIKFNGTFAAWDGTHNIVDKTGLTVDGMGRSKIEFDSSGKATINGKELKDGDTVQLADGGTAQLKGNVLTVTTGEGYTITQTAVHDGHHNYINTDVKTGEDGVGLGGHDPTGILGQTFRAKNDDIPDTEKDPERYAKQFEEDNLFPPSPLNNNPWNRAA